MDFVVQRVQRTYHDMAQGGKRTCSGRWRDACTDCIIPTFVTAAAANRDSFPESESGNSRPG